MEVVGGGLWNFFADDKFLQGFKHGVPWLWEPNCTNALYMPFLYSLCMVYEFRNILEIGVDQGHGTNILGYVAKKNNGQYVGIDINGSRFPHYKRYFEGLRYPVKFIEADTKEMTEIPMDKIDFVFIDGEHKTEPILHEVEMIWPKLQGKGWGYIAFHDVVDQGAQDAWKIVKEKYKDQAEFIAFHPNGGLGLMRKMI